MERLFQKGDVVFSQGSIGEECFVILDGYVEISRREDNGSTTQLAQLGPGEFFGEMAVVDGHPRSATATAASADTRILAINHGQFVYLISAQPAFALHLLEHFSARSRQGALKPVPRPLKSRQPAGDTYVVTEVSTGVHFLQSKTHACHSYLFRGREKTILIDSGLPSTGAALEATLASLGLRIEDIDLLVLTHEHIDHVGGMTKFSNRPDTFAHQYTASKLETGDEFGMMCSAFSERLEPTQLSGLLSPGDLLNTGVHALRVYHTPGHSSGSITLHDENSGIVVSGDLVLANGSLGGIFVSGSPSDSIASLRSIAALEPRLALPGHGPLLQDPAKSIEKAIRNCQDLIRHSHAMFAALDHSSASGRIISAFQEINRKWLSA
jgi:glyoxylase-like metal-dependent hydrolase (beta-lactamase superfamily II)